MRLLAAIVLLGASTASPAAQQWSEDRMIDGLGVVTVDPVYPQYSNTIWVGVDDLTWLPEHCRQFPGILFSDTQTAMLDLLMTAMERRLPVTLKVDDAAMIGDYCTLFQVTLHAPEAAQD